MILNNSNYTLITGANGFIGCALTKQLSNAHLSAKAIVRNENGKSLLEPFTKDVFCGSIEQSIESNDAFTGVSTVVHLAARVHRMNESGMDGMEEARSINRDLTIKLARASLKEGVKKFIFISTVKVMGDTASNVHQDLAQPDDPYGISKWEAEEELRKMFEAQSDAQCIILRLPMVYGPGNKGNMLTLLKAASKNKRLPLGATKGKRSMIYIENVCDAILKIISDETSGRPVVQTYAINDGVDMTSGELYSLIYRTFHNNDGIYSVPESLLRFCGSIGSLLWKLSGKKLPVNNGVISRLFDEYRFSSELFSREYNWSAPFTPEEGIRRTVNWYKS